MEARVRKSRRYIDMARSPSCNGRPDPPEVDGVPATIARDGPALTFLPHQPITPEGRRPEMGADRWLVRVGLGLSAATLVWTVASVGAAAPAPLDPVTATEALSRLKAGNARFVAHPEEALPIDAARRAALAQGQAPFATLLSCADSRVPPEVIFHASLGDLFVVRAAGNVTDKAILASVEYAAEHLHVPLVVVMGHESCGAVKAAVETPAGKSLGPNLDYLIKAIRPSVAAVASEPESARLRAAILKNVEESVNDLIAESAILKHQAGTGMMIVVAYYELGSGRVFFSEPALVSAAQPESHAR
jgi:carbonic anhydrase